MRFSDWFKRKGSVNSEDNVQNLRKEVVGMNSDFMNGIMFEENPFEDEVPDRVVVYDINGKEVKA